MTQIKNIALIGANGTLGPSILDALYSSKSDGQPSFKVSVLSRASSKSKYPPEINTITISDSYDVGELATALKGQDALVVTMSANYVKEQIALADACLAAGVSRYIPADYGSCDSADEATINLLPIYKNKRTVRNHLETLAKRDNSALSWTSLIGGHFFDWGLAHKLLHFNVAEHKAQILDGGDVRFSATTLEMYGTAVCQVLLKPELSKNRLLYIHSFCISQNELLKALERATGSDWEVEHLSSKALIEGNQEKAAEGDADAVEHVVAAHGLVAANWERKADFANEELGLPREDLDSVIIKVLKHSSV